MRNRGTVRRQEAGNAILELALLLPLLIFILCGTIDIGRAMGVGITIANAARAGAQYGMQSTAASLDTSGIKQAARNDASDLQLTDDDITVTRTGTTCTYVQVTAQVGFQSLLPYPGVPSPLIVSRTATMRVQ